jgi:peptidoglycan-associated lipoprotein
MELSRWRKAGISLSAAILAAFAVAACSNTPKPENELAQGSSRNSPATPGSARDFAVNVGDIVYFTTDSTDLSPEAQQTLNNQARWLQQYSQYTITIEGHADERGTREYNIALGARRAQAVRNYLAQHGVNGQRIRTISYGKERPVAVCNDISCWSQNRRAQTVLNSRHEAARS